MRRKMIIRIFMKKIIATATVPATAIKSTEYVYYPEGGHRLIVKAPDSRVLKSFLGWGPNGLW